MPFLGAGANLCGREGGWVPGKNLPSGRELAEYLATDFGVPEGLGRDLTRVAQFAAISRGGPILRARLRELFVGQHAPNALHLFLAQLPKRLGADGRPAHLLFVTTNYDDTLEQALRAAGEDFDVVTYAVEKPNRGKFVHRRHGEPDRVVKTPNKYLGFDFRARSVVLKVHGAVDNDDKQSDSYVITEDDYIDYLTNTDLAKLVPVQLAEKLRSSNLLFLGYSMADWNLRVILHRISEEERFPNVAWAVQWGVDPLEERFWQRRDVTIYDIDLGEYVAALETRLPAL